MHCGKNNVFLIKELMFLEQKIEIACTRKALVAKFANFFKIVFFV
jgi:hypothetical protein